MIQFENEHLTVFQSVLYQTTTAIIQTEDAVIMTDPTWLPTEIQAIQQYIDKIIGNRQLLIVFTHSDFDHILAAGAFLDAQVIASKAFVNRKDTERVLEEIAQFDAQYYIERTYPIIYPNVDFIIEKNGQEITIGDVTLTFYLAPGHTDDGLFTVVEPYGILLAGDYLSDVEFPFFTDWEAYYETLHKASQIVEKQAIKTLVPGHGMTTNDNTEIQTRIDESLQYLTNLKEGTNQESYLASRYPFFKGLKEMHEANRALMKK